MFVALLSACQSSALSTTAVRGNLTYDFVPTVCDAATGGCYLDYANTVQKPIRNVVVQLLDASATTQLGETTSDDAGAYTLPTAGATSVRVVALAQMSSPAFLVQDNAGGSPPPIYALSSDVLDASQGAALDLHAASGWDASAKAYTGMRAAAPFAVLDVVYSEAKAFASVRNVQFDALSINWSAQNRPEGGDPSLGQIGTTHWDPKTEELYILGAADIDTDEYDTHVVAHEWGHYFEWTQSRSDSMGGEHSFGDVLDLRVAFSEGWGNSIGAMVFYPDTLYSDTSGVDQGSGFSFDVASHAVDSFPGWFSEASVQTLLLDIFDPPSPADPNDHVEAGLGGVYDVFIGPHKHTPAMTSVFSWVSGLKLLHPDWSADIDTLTGEVQIAPVQDDFATGETNDAGSSMTLPIYINATPGQSGLNVMFQPTGDPSSDFNKSTTNRYLRILGDGQPLQVSSRSSAEIDLYLTQNGNMLAFSQDGCGAPPNCQDTLQVIPTTPGVEYIVNAGSWASAKGDLPCTLVVAH